MATIYQTAAEIQTALAARIKKMRLANNHSQEEVASRAGISLRAYQNLEAGGNATVETLMKILRVLGINGADVVPALPEESPIELFHGRPARARAAKAR